MKKHPVLTTNKIINGMIRLSKPKFLQKRSDQVVKLPWGRSQWGGGGEGEESVGGEEEEEKEEDDEKKETDDKQTRDI